MTLVLLMPGHAAATGDDPEAQHIADACTLVDRPEQDLLRASFGFNAEGLQVATQYCGRLSQPDGDWLVTFHLTSFEPEVQITSVLQDVGRYETWTGYRLCAESSCPFRHENGDFLVTPAGTALDGPYSGAAVDEDLSTSSDGTFGYGAWPAGVTPPSRIEWYVEVRAFDGSIGPLIDRAPDVGTIPSPLLPPGRAPQVSVTPGPASTYNSLRSDTGTVAIDGRGLEGRQVTIQSPLPPHFRESSDAAGQWWSLSWQTGNRTVVASVQPDGVHAAGRSAPFHAYVRAFTSLDVPAGLRRNAPVELRGVVRPRATGAVDVLVKPFGTQSAWKLLRRTPLVAGRTDTYYRVSWTPLVRGRFVLFTRWTHGTTDDGGVLNGQSSYRVVTVS